MWDEVWKLLTEMEGLEVLRINLWWMWELDSWVKPGSGNQSQVANVIAKVTRLQVFEITLPPRVRADDSVFDDFPCTVLRREESS